MTGPIFFNLPPKRPAWYSSSTIHSSDVFTITFMMRKLPIQINFTIATFSSMLLVHTPAKLRCSPTSSPATTSMPPTSPLTSTSPTSLPKRRHPNKTFWTPPSHRQKMNFNNFIYYYSLFIQSTWPFHISHFTISILMYSILFLQCIPHFSILKFHHYVLVYYCKYFNFNFISTLE